MDLSQYDRIQQISDSVIQKSEEILNQSKQLAQNILSDDSYRKQPEAEKVSFKADNLEIQPKSQTPISSIPINQVIYPEKQASEKPSSLSLKKSTKMSDSPKQAPQIVKQSSLSPRSQQGSSQDKLRGSNIKAESERHGQLEMSQQQLIESSVSAQPESLRQSGMDQRPNIMYISTNKIETQKINLSQLRDSRDKVQTGSPVNPQSDAAQSLAQ